MKTLHFYVTASLLVLLSTASLAQVDSNVVKRAMAPANVVEGNLHKRFGFRAGVNFSELSGSAYNTTTMKKDFYLTGYYQARLRHNLGLMMELGYSQMGCYNHYGPPYYSVAGTTDLNFDYLMMPITLKYYATKALNLQVGGYVSALLSATEDGVLGYNNQYGPQSLFISDIYTSSYSTIDAGYGIGLGYDLKFGLNFSLKYYGGLVNIEKQYKTETGKGLHNQNFQFAIGYSLPAKEVKKIPDTTPPGAN